MIIISASTPGDGQGAKSTSGAPWNSDRTPRFAAASQVLTHTSRFFEALFFIYSGPHLNPHWAFWAGWGDVITALICIPVAAIASEHPSPMSLRIIWACNIFGSIDILAASASAIKLIIASPDTMLAIRSVPPIIVRLFFVTLMIYLYVLITRRFLVGRSCLTIANYGLQGILGPGPSFAES